MLTDLQKSKMTALFNMFDIDRNGVLEQSDFDKVAVNLAEARHAGPGSAARDTLVAQYRVVWGTLRQLADADGSDSITLEEWLSAFATLLPSKVHFEGVVMMLSNLVFDTFDIDGDNFVISEEYRLFVKAYQVPNASPAEAFKRLDADGDGRLSRADIMRLTGEYFQSSDPKAAGNALFGQV